MAIQSNSWDFLVITSSNEAQAETYSSQIRLRERLGLLSQVKEILVIPDPNGVRIGSGASTIYCLKKILIKEGVKDEAKERTEFFQGKRILIVHAGGDSKRLPAYSPCGKLFIPVPGEIDCAAPLTLFDRQIKTYLDLPQPSQSRGQVVITSGDVLLNFDPKQVSFDAKGLIGVGALAAPEEAAKHGVFCCDDQGAVQRFLQKPDVQEQKARHAVNPYNQTLLDLGIMGFDPEFANTLMELELMEIPSQGPVKWVGALGEATKQWGMDFYNEICCALGHKTKLHTYLSMVSRGGSKWEEAPLSKLYEKVSQTPFSVQILPKCGFHHFGATHQIIHSGLELLRMDQEVSQLRSCLKISNQVEDTDLIKGTNAWIEGCRIRAELLTSGHNVVVGVDIDKPLRLDRKCCLSVLQGHGVWYAVLYGVDDLFKDLVSKGAKFCNMDLLKWLDLAGLDPEEVWDSHMDQKDRTLWDAKVFPTLDNPLDFEQYLWFYHPENASFAQKEKYKNSARSSLAQIALLADQEGFYQRRSRIRAEELRRSLRQAFQNKSKFSAQDLGFVLSSLSPERRTAWVKEVLKEAQWRYNESVSLYNQSFFAFSRIIHSLGQALKGLAQGENRVMEQILPNLEIEIPEELNLWLEGFHLNLKKDTQVVHWVEQAKNAAFDQVGKNILFSVKQREDPPKNSLRSDEIVWGRAPARLDMGGGWTDTPPYSLEHGGCVLNAAVNLNGQPPIQAFARVIKDPVLRIGSIDLGAGMEIRDLRHLMDYRVETSEFSLAKAALALSGFSHSSASWPKGATLEKMLQSFGGGIELTTLAAIPKGSGLGTSSIMGAVILGVLNRILGQRLNRKELFHSVLRLEQALTTGGGWQDQIGGVVDGVKMASTEPGLAPDAMIHFTAEEVLDPKMNGQRTLLYYTGITRLAKNILQQVVGRYLNRDRRAMATLALMRQLPAKVADAMSRRDLESFGGLIGRAWSLNKELDPDSTNTLVDNLMDRIKPHVYGAKLLGAGGGGFLLMVCKSRENALAIKKDLMENPPNRRARFFDFEVSHEGLMITVS